MRLLLVHCLQGATQLVSTNGSSSLFQPRCLLKNCCFASDSLSLAQPILVSRPPIRLLHEKLDQKQLSERKAEKERNMLTENLPSFPSFCFRVSGMLPVR